MKRKLVLLGYILAAGSALHAQETMTVANGANISVQENANMYVGGGFTLASSSSLSNKGTIVVAKNDFTDHSPVNYSYGPGKIVFSGNSLQRISTVNTIGQLEVNNKGLLLLSDITAVQWVLKNGVVNTGDYSAIALGSAPDDVTGAGANKNYNLSWFNGRLRRYIDPQQSAACFFPVGDDRRLRYCLLDNMSGESLKGVHSIEASFTGTTNLSTITRTSENGYVYNGLNQNGMWKLVPDVEPAAGKYNLRVSLAGFSGIRDNQFGLLNQSGLGWNVPAGSSLPAEGADGRTLFSGFAQRNQLSQFGEFAIGEMRMPEKDNSFSVKVFPDPVTDYQFFVQLTNCQLKELRLFTADGSPVQASSVVQKNDQVKVMLPPSFAKGTYTAQLLTDKGTRTTKIIVL